MRKSASNLKGLLSPYLKRQRLKKISKHIPAGCRILDIGCDDGALLRYISPCEYYLGIDVSPDVIVRNQKSWKMENAEFRVADVHDFPLPDIPFDVIIMAAVIEHLKDYYTALKRMHESAAARARLLITTPAPAGDLILKAGSLLKIFDRQGFKEHQHYFSRKDFLNISGWEMELYRKFEWGLNQLVILRKTASL